MDGWMGEGDFVLMHADREIESFTYLGCSRLRQHCSLSLTEQQMPLHQLKHQLLFMSLLVQTYCYTCLIFISDLF